MNSIGVFEREMERDTDRDTDRQTESERKRMTYLQWILCRTFDPPVFKVHTMFAMVFFPWYINIC